MSAARRELRAFLAAAEVEPGELARDPLGRTWLPPGLADRVQADPGARADLARFVAAERALFAGAHVDPDPFFVRRVISCLPPAPPPSPAARIGVLALFHALGDVDGWFDAAHGALDQTLAAPGALWPAQIGPLALALTVLAAGLGLLATRARAAHTRGA